MNLVRFVLVALGILYAHHAFGQDRSTFSIIQQATPGQWVVINPSTGTAHVVIYDPSSGLLQDSLVNSGSQQYTAPMPDNCGFDPQTGGYYCQ